MPVPVRGLFEAHLAVRDPVRSSAFYRDILGLQFAYDAPDVGATFFWIGGPGKGMLGLWTMGSTPMSVSLHVAFDVALPALLDAPSALRSLGVIPLSFFEQEADEPNVIGWMPAAAVYFRDPDGHLLEYLRCSTRRRDPTSASLPGRHGRCVRSGLSPVDASSGCAHSASRPFILIRAPGPSRLGTDYRTVTMPGETFSRRRRGGR